MEPVTGPSSILLLDGERHMRMRKLMLPPFHGEAIEHYAELIEEITNREIDGWRPGERIHTRAVAQKITMEVIIRAVFGITDPGAHRRAAARAPATVVAESLLLLVQKDLGPRSPWGRFLRVRDRVDRLLYAEIEGRRSDSEARGARRHPRPAPVRARRGGRAAHRPGAARRADHAPAGRPRDDREVDRVGVRAAASHPAALERLTAEVEAGESGTTSKR